ncbi:LysE family transporter [Roseovarius salinarum]|uniref:LysE family transporter n=1 Tax=Roseovarius salinarum TaxID=1981892 RepID=UPI000C31DD7B|nr:LysE family transporter [Roseovarius salinarum]
MSMSLSDPLLIIAAWAVAAGSPGPATLAISGAAMAQGRGSGLATAAGVACGSASWGVAAALGMSALMLAHAWVFSAVKVVGAAYLLYLAARSLWRAWQAQGAPATVPPRGRLFMRGLLVHLTNPKAVLAWGAVFAVALPGGAGASQVWQLFALLFATSAVIFVAYALAFSVGPVARGYARLQRAFDVAFGMLFGAAGLKLLTARLP